MSNQTIDGVSRRMLTALLCHVSESENRALVDELRALLNREVITDDHLRQRIAFLTSEVHSRANERDAALNELAELKAAQPQGEPVAWMAVAIGKDGEVYRKATSSTEFTLRDAKYAWGEGVLNRFTVVICPLYTEQPAPVEMVTVAEAWEACGGNPGIKADRTELLTALRLMNEAEDEQPATVAVVLPRNTERAFFDWADSVPCAPTPMGAYKAAIAEVARLNPGAKP